MDDERIRQLRDEVLAAIREPAPLSTQEASLSARVAVLEDAVRALQATTPSAVSAPTATLVAVAHAEPAPRASIRAHPSLRLLDVPRGVERCELEPDKPCIESGRCRAFGH